MRSNPPKAEMIKARIEPADKRVLFAAAHRRGLTLSEFIRDTAISAARQGEAG